MASKENADGKKGGSDQSWSIPTADPNNLLYKDGDGIERSIYLPQGTMHQAWDHLVNERWDELAKYEPYVNQGYKDSDFKKWAELKKRGQ